MRYFISFFLLLTSSLVLANTAPGHIYLKVNDPTGTMIEQMLVNMHTYQSSNSNICHQATIGATAKSSYAFKKTCKLNKLYVRANGFHLYQAPLPHACQKLNPAHQYATVNATFYPAQGKLKLETQCNSNKKTTFINLNKQ